MSRLLLAGGPNVLGMESRFLLEAKGYKIISCSNIQQSLAFVLEDPPDIIIVEKGFDEGKDRELIQSAKTCLQKTFIPILLVVEERLCSSIDMCDYPVDDIIVPPVTPEHLVMRVHLTESRITRVFDNNPLSKLPGNTSIIKAIQRTIDSGTEMGVCYLDIDNFKPYNDRYGFAQGDDVILMVARITVNVVEELARGEGFVGHVGGDDFVFTVAENKIEPVCKKILSNFEIVRNMFLSAEDLKVGCFMGKDRQGNMTRFELLGVSIAAVTTGKNKFKHYGEIAAVASQLKHQVKKAGGADYLIDRRSLYSPQ